MFKLKNKEILNENISFYLLYVCFYDETFNEINFKVNSFLNKLGIKNYQVIKKILINNSNLNFKSSSSFECIKGSNSLAEFSAYKEGICYLKKLNLNKNSIIIFLNDSYLLNWNFSFISKFFTKKLLSKTIKQKSVGLWQDTGSWPYSTKGFIQNSNSRFFFLHIDNLFKLHDHLEYNIKYYERLSEKKIIFKLEEKLNRKNYEKYLNIISFKDRWRHKSRYIKLKCVLIELTLNQLNCTLSKSPNGLIEAIIYSFFRKLINEKR